MAMQRHCPVKLKQMSLLPSSVRIWYTEENVRLFKGQKEDGANRGGHPRTYLFIMADIHTDHAEDSRDASNRLKSDIDSSRHDRKIRKKNQNSLRKRQQHMRIVYLGALAAILVLILAVAGITVQKKQAKRAAVRAEKAAEIESEESALDAKRSVISQAETMAKGYDYDGAVALLQSQPTADTDSELKSAIAKITAEKAMTSAVDTTDVPHIFFHSLIVDTDRAFNTKLWSASDIAGTDAWMTTLDEFDKIIQQLYDNGYVLIRMRDLVTQTTDADGTVHFTTNKSLMLPEGKKPIVLSIDDWSYYHTYEGHGYADKAVLDKNGEVKCQYTDAKGKVSVGDYDVVPRLNTFCEKHPDFSYRGARGLIAMTGYNGVFGYRTDTAYKTGENLDDGQKAWLKEHPDFNWDDEVAEAKKIADAVKSEGWEFACHTWGHLSVTNLPVEALETDQEKWQATVANITGKTDTIIFAHGADIGTWKNYDASTNADYAYLKSMGYNFYANVDASSKYWIQIRDGYVRQGRIDCDGYQMWRALSGEAKINVFEDLFDVKSVFDSSRPTPVRAVGKA